MKTAACSGRFAPRGRINTMGRARQMPCPEVKAAFRITCVVAWTFLAWPRGGLEWALQKMAGNVYRSACEEKIPANVG